MQKIGGLLFAEQSIMEGETVLWSRFANRTQSEYRAVGGKLFLTNQRLLFSPHFIDHLTGGEKWSVDLVSIQTIDKQPEGGDLFGGGLRDRLRISLHNGGVELFVVNDLDSVIEYLQASLSAGQ